MFRLDRLSTTGVDLRTVAVAVGAMAVTLPSTLPMVRWALSSLRLRLMLLRGKPHPDDETSSVSVAGLFVHPVKSLRSVSLTETTLDRKGLVDDRRFMVVYELPPPKKGWSDGDTTHKFLTQRQCPSLATISATLVDGNNNSQTNDGRVLLLEKHDPEHQDAITASIRIPLAAAAKPAKTHLAGIWDDVVAVDDLGDQAASFLQAVCDADSELQMNPKTVRLVTESKSSPSQPGRDDRSYVPSYAKTWTGRALGKPTLTDGFPVLIASEASLRAVNERLVAKGRPPIPMSRFRPNIVLQGDALRPFEEDTWKVVAIGGVVFAIVKACPRCKQSCTDQITGAVSPELEPLKTLASFRNNEKKQGSVFFAQNAIPLGKLEGQTIRVGDPVRVLERGDPVYID